MSTQGIILTVFAFLFLFLEVSAIVQHWFERSRGVFILKKENTKRQIILHSTFDQLAIGLIVNYESGFFISLHVLNLHFCFIHIPKQMRAASPATVSYVQERPLTPIVEWMNRGIEAANEIGGASELYFKALEQGYTLDDIDLALEHFRGIGATALYDMHKQEIILRLK